MGGFVASSVVLGSQADLNIRFAAGDAIVEMKALQSEFGVFSAAHTLRSSAQLLGLAPVQEPQRSGWLDFLDSLMQVPSDLDGVSGHDRIRDALRQNLEGSPQPVWFGFHDAADDPRVTVSSGRPISFLSTSHVVISVPTQNAGDALREAVKSAPRWTERKAAAKKTAANKTAAKTAPAKTGAAAKKSR